MMFGDLLREYREREGLTQKALAERLRRDSTALSHLERGERDPASRTEVIRLAQAMSLPAADLDSLLLSAGYAPSAVTLAPNESVESAKLDFRYKIECLARFYSKFNSMQRLLSRVQALQTVNVEYLLRQACRVLDPLGANVNRASLILPTDDGEDLVIQYQTGIDQRSVRERRFAATIGVNGDRRGLMGVAGWTYATGDMQVVKDVNSDPRFLKLPSRPEAPYNGLLCAPLLQGETCLGVISFDSMRGSFDAVDRELAALIASAFAALIAPVQRPAQSNGDIPEHTSDVPVSRRRAIVDAR